MSGWEIIAAMYTCHSIPWNHILTRGIIRALEFPTPINWGYLLEKPMEPWECVVHPECEC